MLKLSHTNCNCSYLTFIARVTHGEIALILSVIGDGTTVSPERLRQWMGEDRLPDGWTRPQRTQGLIETITMARRVTAAAYRANVNRVADHVDHGDPSSTRKRD